MERKDSTTVTRTIELKGGSIDDLLGVARLEVSKAQVQGWRVTDVSAFSTKDPSSNISENVAYITMERAQ